MQAKVTRTMLVTVAKELNNLLGMEPPIIYSKIKVKELQDRIIEAADLIEPEDELSDTALVFFDLIGFELPEGIRQLPKPERGKIDKPATKKAKEAKEAGEEEDAPAPVFKNKVFESPSKVTRVMMMVVDNPTITVDRILSAFETEGLSIAKGTVQLVRADTLKVLAYLKYTQ